MAYAMAAAGRGGGGGGAGRLDMLSAEGEGTIYYPSGRIALTACKSADGFFYTFTADAARFQARGAARPSQAAVLASFDADGVGGVNRLDGKPWLVVTTDGWSLSAPGGRIERAGRWPRTPGAREPISLQVTPQLSVEFVDRQSISATLKDVPVVRALPGGKLELDDVGSVYVPKGPHHFATARPGLGNLKSMLASVRAGSPITAMVADLDASQERVQRIKTLAITPYCTAHPPRRLSAPLPDFGSPELRRRLPPMSVAELDVRVAGPAAPRDVAFAVCVLADWNPAAWFELSEAAAADGSGDAAHVRLARVDASEGRGLQRRHGFRTAPMFLWYYQGALVDAGNDEMVERSLAALAEGRRGGALPPGFSFGGRDNARLDGITGTMSLLRGA
ncbi:MAG: hypothetical protein J3K34DRAFT_469930 [Monoraphidium minutum]|nr:MAG: hypothetical protein J3K34DRAFT_469930 [Monoraphidium minutum]